MIPNRVKTYKNNKKILSEKAKEKYRNLSEEAMNKRKNYRKNRYHVSEDNMSEEKKQKLKEYQKKYQQAKKYNYNNE